MKRSGFTIPELLTTIVIISILTALASVSFTTLRQKHRDSKRKSDLATIDLAIGTYYEAQGPRRYPVFCTGTGNSYLPGTVSIGYDAHPPTGDTGFSVGTEFAAIMVPVYMTSVPTDPLNRVDGSKNHYYSYVSAYGVTATTRTTRALCQAEKYLSYQLQVSLEGSSAVYTQP